MLIRASALVLLLLATTIPSPAGAALDGGALTDGAIAPRVTWSQLPAGGSVVEIRFGALPPSGVAARTDHTCGGFAPFEKQCSNNGSIPARGGGAHGHILRLGVPEGGTVNFQGHMDHPFWGRTAYWDITCSQILGERDCSIQSGGSAYDGGSFTSTGRALHDPLTLGEWNVTVSLY